MFESSRSYFLKTDHIIVPMFRGTNSRKALKISYDMARFSHSEITAITIREKKENVDAYGRLNLVTAAYNEGKKAFLHTSLTSSGVNSLSVSSI